MSYTRPTQPLLIVPWKSPSTFHAPVPLIASVGVPLGLGFLMSKTMGNAVQTWYKYDLKKPSWTPPSNVFPVVWSVLYTSMGYASHRIAHLAPANTSDALPWRFPFPLVLYGTQLVLNLAWTPLFFHYKRFDLAAVEVTALTSTVWWTVYEFSKWDSLSAWLMVPYALWSTYATALTINIARNNRGFRFRVKQK
ncbi:hypothetical protein RI367_006033 [Sorochytrium milnesiophthora]